MIPSYLWNHNAVINLAIGISLLIIHLVATMNSVFSQLNYLPLFMAQMYTHELWILHE